MKAVGYTASLPIDAAEALIDFEIAKPEPVGRDIRVAVKAVSVNPVDTKVRKRAAPPAGETKILGYDAAGIVDAVGPDVTMFKPGDEVFYAGSILRQGTNAEFHLVDERIVGNKPKTLSFAQAAALPLTSITAWELLFDRLGALPGRSVDPRSLLIVGGAGGVGSILIQLARRLTGLTVIATASRPETVKWCQELGAHAVIDHSQPMKPQIKALKLPPVALIASLTGTDDHFPALADILAPQGRIGLIDDPVAVNFSLLKGKAGSLHWESMFTRSS
ncbi:MAG: NADPH:quinone reductase, partial [Tardiphaga sp.]|nr:NADPH:quinone reductase [Tardiphaga sp.]